MNSILHKMLALALALGLVATGLFAAIPPITAAERGLVVLPSITAGPVYSGAYAGAYSTVTYSFSSDVSGGSGDHTYFWTTGIYSSDPNPQGFLSSDANPQNISISCDVFHYGGGGVTVYVDMANEVFGYGYIAIPFCPPAVGPVGSLDFALSTTTPATGDAVTLTPTGDYAILSPSDTVCSYTLTMTSVNAIPDSATAAKLDTSLQAFSVPVDGKCPAWTFTLPNLDSVVDTGGLPTIVSANIKAWDRFPAIQIASPWHTMTYQSSTAESVSSSNLPAIMGSLDIASLAQGQAATATFTTLGFADSGPNSLVAGPFIWADTNTSFPFCDGNSYTRTGSYNQPASSPSISFTQGGCGTAVQVRVDVMGQFSDFGPFSLQSTIYAINPDYIPTPAPEDITLCHYQAADSYAEVKATINNYEEAGSLNGHINDLADVIPSFVFGTFNYPGQNVDSKGQDLLLNHCVVPPTITPSPTLTPTPTPAPLAIDLALSTTTPATGEAVTLTPTGDRVPNGAICTYVMKLASWHRQGVAVSFEARALAVDGVCPAWTFVLPNLERIVDIHGMAASVSVSIYVGNASSPTHTLTYDPSASLPSASSNLPTIMAIVSNTKPTIDQSVTLTPLFLGFAASGPSSLVGNPTVSAHYEGLGAPNRPVLVQPDPFGPITFFQGELGTCIDISQNTEADNGLTNMNLCLSTYGESGDPISTPSPSPVVSSSPSVSPSASPSSSSSSSPKAPAPTSMTDTSTGPGGSDGGNALLLILFGLSLLVGGAAYAVARHRLAALRKVN